MRERRNHERKCNKIYKKQLEMDVIIYMFNRIFSIS